MTEYELYVKLESLKSSVQAQCDSNFLSVMCEFGDGLFESSNAASLC